MRKLLNLVTISAGLALVHIPASAQLIILNVGDILLQENQPNQMVDISIQNTGSSALDNIFGLNFALQVSDGSSGPHVTDVSLYAGNSIFSANALNQTDQGSTSRILFYGIDAGGTPLSLAAQSSTLLARLTLDTTGLSAGSGPWSVSASDVGPLHSATEYVLVGGASRPIDTIINGTISIVPEPASCSMATALFLVIATLGACLCRRGLGIDQCHVAASDHF